MHLRRLIPVVALVAAWSSIAHAQPAKARPKIKGRTHTLKVDSSPQQAAVYWDVGGSTTAREYGIAGYTPISIKVPRGSVRLIVELKGWKAIDKDVDIKKSQSLSFTLERAPQAGKLELRAGGDGSAAGAEVSIDGVPRGTIPNTFEMTAGRHQLEIKKAGMKTLSDWIELREDELRTRDVTLEKSDAGTGTILVVSDGGGDVYLDGEKKDVAPTVINGVKAGDHVIEIKKDGQQPWRQTVTVVAGQQAKVTAALASNAVTGSVRVLASEQDTEIFLDGQPVGKAPADLPAVKAGQHLIEGRKKGFKSAEEAIKLTPNEQLLVRLKLEASVDTPKGMLRVQSTVPNAEVFFDGASVGRAPVDRNDLEPGKHFVIVKKDGYVEFKREVLLVEGKPIVLVADLQAVATLKFLSSPDGAQVFIDGEPLPGVTPTLRESVSAGEHQIMFRKSGYNENKQIIKVEGGKERIVSADLVRAPTGPTPEQMQKRKAGMSSLGARALPPGGFTADVGTGFPYYLNARLTVSAVQLKPILFDAGVEFRTYFQMFEFGVHGRAQIFEAGPLSVGAKAMIGGGGGPGGRNTFFTEGGPVVSLSFLEIVTFSGFAKVAYWTDKLCPSQDAIDRGDLEPSAACLAPSVDNFYLRGGEMTSNPIADRYDGLRLYTGFHAEVAIDRRFSVWSTIEFLPGQRKSRVAFRNGVNGAMMFDKDPKFYGAAGATMKF